MAIEEIYLELTDRTLPENVGQMIAGSDRLVKEFYSGDRNRENPNFVPCDPA